MKAIQFIFLLLLAGNSAFPQYRASEWEERDKWQHTGEILESLDLEPSMKVADIGCHEGYMTMKMSPLVGAEGVVFAVDIEKYKLNKLDKRLKEQAVSNVRTIHGEKDDPKLPKGSLDRILILDTYHEIKDYERVLEHLYQALKPGGKLIVIEPIADDRRSWTREKQGDKHEISMRFVVEDLKQAGFQINKKLDPFIDRPSKSDKMWMVVAVRAQNN